MNSKNLSEGLQSYAIPGGNFNFTGLPVGDPNMAMEQTLYFLAVDESGSTMGFRPEMSKATQEIVKSLTRSPRADNLMYRMTHFSTGIREIHGWKPLRDCNVGDYANTFLHSGCTDLYDAACEGAESMRIYAEDLAKNRYLANGVLVIITDGCNLGSTYGVNDVRRMFEQLIKGEMLESLMTILVGVNINSPAVKAELDEFQKKAGFTQFIAVEDATEKTMAKVADFISRSVSSQSSALGTGGASQSLTF